MSLTLVTPPAEEPITLAEAKLHARVTTSDDDALITAMITAARQRCESITRRALVTQTWDLFLDAFPTVIEVPLPNLQSITTLKYIDTDGVQQTWSSANYRVDTDKKPGRITPAYDETWPSIRTITNAIEIRFVAGYGAASTVPEAIRNWLKVYVGNMYGFREQFVTGTIVADIPFVDGLLDDYRIYSF